MTTKTDKCWGTNFELFKNSSVSVNLIQGLKGTRCSWHKHKTKYNLFYLLSGAAAIQTQSGIYDLELGCSFVVDPGDEHEFQIYEDCQLIEVMYVEYDPRDIERFIVGGFLAGK